ncbi:MAG: hypothetical protein AB7S38_30240 [Vulcanimicrobiota bacterium]
MSQSRCTIGSQNVYFVGCMGVQSLKNSKQRFCVGGKEALGSSILGEVVLVRASRFFLLLLGLLLVGCESGQLVDEIERGQSRPISHRNRVLAELTLQTENGPYKLVKGRGLIPAENSPVPQPRTGDGVRARTGESILAATELPPEYFFGAHYQFDVDKRNFFIGEEPVGTACVRYNSEEFNNLPHSSEAYRFGNLEFASLGVAVGPNQFPGTASTTMVVSTPAGIEEIEIPKMDGDTITVSPPITVRMDYAYTPIPNSSLYYGRTETFVNGNSVAISSSNFTIGVSVELPSVHGIYTTENHAERQTYANAPFQLQDSFDVGSQVFARKLEFADDFTPMEFTPGQPVTITNSFRWDSGPTDVVDARWEVIVEDTLENQFTRFQEGTGTDISATFDLSDVLARGQVPRRYVLIPAGSPLEASIKQEQARLRARGEDIRAQTDVIPLTYRVIASAEAYPRSRVFPLVGSQFYQARYYAVNSQISPALRIRDINIDPNPFEPSPPEVAPEDRQVAVISAYVDANGFDGGYVLVEPRIYDQAGNLVKTFEDQYPIDYVELEWDGYDDEGNPLDPQEFLVELQAHVCDFSGPAREILAEIAPQTLQLGSCSLTGDVAQAPLVTGGAQGGELKVYAINKLIAWGKNPTSAIVTRAQEGFLRDVYAAGPTAPGDPQPAKLKLEASNLGPVGGDVTVVARGNVSQVDSVAVTLTDDDHDGTYTGELLLTPDFIKVGGPLTDVQGEAGRMTFSVGERLNNEGGVTAAIFANLLSALGPEFYPYPKPAISLGKFEEDLLGSQLTLANDDEATATANNLASTGFEALTLTLRVGSDVVVTTKAKVRHPADVLFWNFHGLRHGSLSPESEIAKRENRLPTILLTPEDFVVKPVARTVMFAACDVLCLNDYNGAWPNESNFGGRRWYAAMDTPGHNTVLLGFTAQTGATLTTSEVIELYGKRIDDYIAAGETDRRKIQALAWVRANLEVGLNLQADGSTGPVDALRSLQLRACAYAADSTGEYFYYIPVQHRPTQDLALVLQNVETTPVVKTAEGIYRVRREHWGEPVLFDVRRPKDAQLVLEVVRHNDGTVELR